MKILLVTEFFFGDRLPAFTGGVEARTYFIYKYLNRENEVKVISRNRSKIEVSFLSIFPRLLFQIVAFIKGSRIKADVIEGSNFTSYLPAYMIARHKNAKAVAWFADVYEDIWFKEFSFIAGLSGFLMEKIALKLSWDRVIAMSRSTENKLIKAGVDENKIDVVYGGVELEKIKMIKPNKFKRLTICTVARLVKYKNIDLLIRAVGELKTEISDIRLLIFGEGSERSNLEKILRELGLERNVKFYGNKNQMYVWQMMKNSHIFCLPSLVEGFGLVTVEAISAGVVYVNSDIEVTREITNNGKGGLLFEPGNLDDLVIKLRRLINNKLLYKKKKSEGLKLAKAYEWKIISNNTLKAYKKALER